MLCIFCWVWDNDFNLTLRKCRLTKNRQRKGLQKQKRQVLPVVVPEAKTGEFILPLSFLLFSFLLCSFCPEFVSSPYISVSHHAFSNTAPPYLPPPVFLFTVHLSFFLCSLLPHYPFTTCHPVTLFPTPLSLILLTSATLSLALFLPPPLPLLLYLPACLHSQLTFATRRCSCARTGERATRTRSASVLQSLRGYCANNPAARRAKTATPPLRRTSPQPPCCSALC